MSNSEIKIEARDEKTGADLGHTIDLFNNTISFSDEDGKLVKMDLGTPDVHIDAALANYAAGYRQVQGIADVVSPVVPSKVNSDFYFTWDKDDVFQDAQELIIAPGASVKEISPRVSSSQFKCVPFGIGSFVPGEIEANADSPLQPFQAAVNRCMNAIRLGRERRVASLLTTTANWSGGYTATILAGAKWNGGASSNPVQDLLTAIEGSLTPVRAIAMSELALHDFMQNAAVQKYTGYKTMIAPLPNSTLGPQWNAGQLQGNGPTPSEFAGLLGLPPIAVGFMKGKSGASSYGYVWGNDVVLLYNDPNLPSDGQSISTSYTFRWTAPSAPDGTVVDGFLVRTYYDPRRGGRGGRMVVVVHNDAEIVTSAFAGGVLKSVHQ